MGLPRISCVELYACKVCKMFLGLSTKAANLTALGQSVDKHQFLFTQLHSVSSTGFIFWNLKITVIRNKFIYNMLYFYDECNRKNLASKMKDLLCRSVLVMYGIFKVLECLLSKCSKKDLLIFTYKHGVHGWVKVTNWEHTGHLSLTLIYPAHFEDVLCQSGVNHIFEG